jgi:hypothetical protein
MKASVRFREKEQGASNIENNVFLCHIQQEAKKDMITLDKKEVY